MNDPLLTIITPTYNRAKLLPNLYKSLLQQEKNFFIWMIVDDGSTDNTKEVVKTFQEENKFPIKYIHKENGGKHTALNVGIRQIDTELTMIVDSDDTLLPNAVFEIDKYYRKYKDIKRIATWAFLRCYSDGKPIIELDQEEFVENYIKYRIRENRPGDMAEVFRTNVLKDFPFPVFPDEKFISEDVVWIEIGKHYDSVFINKAIYQCEYLEGGLTANDKPMKFASPRGSMLRGKQLMSKECGLKANIRGAIIYDCYKPRDSQIIPNSLYLSGREQVLAFLFVGMGKLFRYKWRGHIS